MVVMIAGLIVAFGAFTFDATWTTSRSRARRSTIMNVLMLSRDRAIATRTAQTMYFEAGVQGTDYRVEVGGAVKAGWTLPRKVAYTWPTGTISSVTITPDGRCSASGLVVLGPPAVSGHRQRDVLGPVPEVLMERPGSNPDDRGLTLMEVMVAMVILSIGILAIARVIAAGSRSQSGGRMESVAGQYANEQFEQLRGVVRSSPSLSAGRHPVSDYRNARSVGGVEALLRRHGLAGSARFAPAPRHHRAVDLEPARVGPRHRVPDAMNRTSTAHRKCRNGIHADRVPDHAGRDGHRHVRPDPRAQDQCDEPDHEHERHRGAAEGSCRGARDDRAGRPRGGHEHRRRICHTAAGGRLRRLLELILSGDYLGGVTAPIDTLAYQPAGTPKPFRLTGAYAP